MKCLAKLVLSAGLVACFQVGCGDDEETDEKKPENKDSASEEEKSSDEEKSTDSDEEKSTDSDTEVEGEEFLKADADGNIGENKWGISGTWFSYSDANDGGDSTITASVSATGGYCAVGEASQIQNGEDGNPAYSTYWGAGIGFNLCYDDTIEGTDDDKALTIADCTAGDVSKIIGFKLTVTGSLPTTELRVTMTEKGRNESTFINAKVLDVHETYLFEKATVLYDATADPIDVSKVKALQFQVSTATSGATPFDFCIENIEPITE